MEVHFCSNCIVVGFYVRKQTGSGNPPNILYKTKINTTFCKRLHTLLKKKKKEKKKADLTLIILVT